MKKMISIIIPCFNSSIIFERCLPSLEQQTCQDFEVVMIDDHSDNRLYGELCEYASKSRFPVTVLENEANRGPGYSRNRGMREASGAYFMFLDSDDSLSYHAVQSLKNIIEKFTPDCVYFDFCKYRKKRKIIYRAYPGNDIWINRQDAMLYANFSTWCKIFRADVLKNAVFPDIRLGEDYVFSKLGLTMCSRIYYCHEILYYYEEHDGSLIKKTEFGKYAELQYTLLKEKMEQRFPFELKAFYIYLMIYCRVWREIEQHKTKPELSLLADEINRACPCWYHDKKIIKKMPLRQRLFLYYVYHKRFGVMKGIVYFQTLLKKIL